MKVGETRRARGQTGQGGMQGKAAVRLAGTHAGEQACITWAWEKQGRARGRTGQGGMQGKAAVGLADEAVGGIAQVHICA